MWLQVRLDIENDPVTNGEYELLKSVCREAASGRSGTFVDIGANIGDWSNEVIENWADGARRTAPAQIHAFEPSPASFLQLRTRLDDAVARVGSQDISVLLNEIAVGKAPARAELSIVSPTGGTNTLVPFDDAVGQTVSVPVTTLDDYAAMNELTDIDFVKVDTEGNDLAVLEGASNLLEGRRIRWIQFEYNHRWVSSRTYLRDAFALAERHGYKLGKITDRGVEAYPAWHPELESFREGNYLLWHDSLPAGVAVLPWWME